jgi:hypothetical protein
MLVAMPYRHFAEAMEVANMTEEEHGHCFNTAEGIEDTTMEPLY